MGILVRPIESEDAAAYVELLSWLDNESRYPVVNILERSMSSADWQSAIEYLHAARERIILVAEVQADEPAPDSPAPDSPALGPQPSRQRLLAGFLSTTSDWFGGVHELRIVIGLRERYTGQGIGTRLFTTLESWARATDVRRLHLTVETDNTRALALYHKMGFEVVGHMHNAVQIQGQWVDDYVMEKWLDAPSAPLR